MFSGSNKRNNPRSLLGSESASENLSLSAGSFKVCSSEAGSAEAQDSISLSLKCRPFSFSNLELARQQEKADRTMKKPFEEEEENSTDAAEKKDTKKTKEEKERLKQIAELEERKHRLLEVKQEEEQKKKQEEELRKKVVHDDECNAKLLQAKNEEEDKRKKTLSVLRTTKNELRQKRARLRTRRGRRKKEGVHNTGGEGETGEEEAGGQGQGNRNDDKAGGG